MSILRKLAGISPCLFLVACTTQPADDIHRYPATVSKNCGYTDGGAYEVNVDLGGGRDISMHAESTGMDDQWQVGRDLEMLVCEGSTDQCSKPDSGTLTLFDDGNQNVKGAVEFEMAGKAESINFVAPPVPAMQGICG